MDDRFDNRRYHTQDTFRVTSTAGAVQIKHEKGEVSLQKVKVERYISGKRPAYAKKEFELDVSENESEDNDFISHRDGPDIKHEHSGRQIDIPENIELDEENLDKVTIILLENIYSRVSNKSLSKCKPQLFSITF